MALFGLKRIYQQGYADKKAGMMLTVIDSAAMHQESLLELMAQTADQQN